MKEAVILKITGASAPEVASILADRVSEFGCSARIERQQDGSECAVAVSTPRPAHDAETLTIKIDEHDTPDFAAEKIIDLLAEKSVIALETGDYTPEEEEKIRKRLQDLGYIE